MSSWDTDGERTSATREIDYEVAALCKVCYRYFRLVTADGETVYQEFLPKDTFATTDGTTSWVADFDSLRAVQRSGSIFKRTEDFGQEVKAITLDSNPYVYVGFEDQFVRAYNNEPRRVRAGNVGEDIAKLCISKDGDVLIFAHDGAGAALASWTNDLNTQNWRVSGIAGTPVEVVSDVLSGDIFIAVYDNAQILRYTQDGNLVDSWTPTANPTDMTTDGRYLYSFGGDGYVEAFNYDGTRAFYEKVGDIGGAIAVVPREDIRSAYNVRPSGNPGYMYIAEFGSRLRKISLEDFQAEWSVNISVQELESFPGPASSEIWKQYLLLEGLEQEDEASAEVGIASGLYYLVLLQAEAHEDTADTNVSLTSGLYESIIVNGPDQDDNADATVSVNSGMYALVVVTAETHDDNADATVSMQSGLYVDVIVAAEDDSDSADTTVSLSGGSYVLA